MALLLASLWSRGLGNSENGLRRHEFAWVCKSAQTYVSKRDFHTNDAAAFYKLFRLGDCWKKNRYSHTPLGLRKQHQIMHWSIRINSAVWPVPYACAQPYHTADISRRFHRFPAKWRLRNEHRSSVFMTRHYQEVKLAMWKGHHLSVEGMVCIKG